MLFQRWTICKSVADCGHDVATSSFRFGLPSQTSAITATKPTTGWTASPKGLEDARPYVMVAGARNFTEITESEWRKGAGNYFTCKNCRGHDGLVGGVNCLMVNAAEMKAWINRINAITVCQPIMTMKREMRSYSKLSSSRIELCRHKYLFCDGRLLSGVH